jgi:hypothetical protein
VLFWNNQGVPRGHRRYVHEGDGLIAFSYDDCADLLSGDFTKEAIAFCRVPSNLSLHINNDVTGFLPAFGVFRGFDDLIQCISPVNDRLEFT